MTTRDVPPERRLAELHLARARELALTIYAASAAPYTLMWNPPYSERVIVDMAEFAFHARRLHELCTFPDDEFLGVDLYLLDFDRSDSDIEFLDNYKHCLNRLVHATSFVKVDAQVRDHAITFGDSPPWMMIYFIVSTKDRPKHAAISLVGITICFLSKVIPAALRKYPGLNF